MNSDVGIGGGPSGAQEPRRAQPSAASSGVHPSGRTRALWRALAVATLALGVVGLQRRGAKQETAAARVGAQSAARVLSFRYVQTVGETEVPYGGGATQLNHPVSVAGDGDGDGVWVAEAFGRRILRLKTSELGVLVVRGRPGLTHGLSDVPISTLSDVRPDGAGRLWVADAGASVVYRLGTDGKADIVLGEVGVPGSDNAHFRYPAGIAFDGLGNIYVSDGAPPVGSDGNERIQVFDAQGVHLATIGETGVGGADNAHLHAPRQIAVDVDQRLYVADSGNHRVQIFDVRTPAVPRYVGTMGRTGVPGTGHDRFRSPSGLWADGTLLYVADAGNCRVEVFNRPQRSYWRTLGGSCGEGPGELRWPMDVTSDASGSAIVADFLKQRVEIFDRDGAHVRGYGVAGMPYVSEPDRFNRPAGVAALAGDRLAIAEEGGHRVSLISVLGSSLWTFGEAGVAGGGETHLDRPADVDVLADGTIVVADSGNNRIVFLSDAGRFERAWGGGGEPALDVRCPRGVAHGPNGRIYVADTCQHRVVVLAADGSEVGSIGRKGVAGQAADALRLPEDIAVDASGQVFVADTGNHRIQVFGTDLVLRRTIGKAGEPGDAFDHLDTPTRLAVDGEDNLFVADAGNQRVQVFDLRGAYRTTIGGLVGSAAGRLRDPHGLSVTSDGGLWVADTENHRLQRFRRGGKDWEQANLNGFGDRNTTQVRSTAAFGGAVYAGTAGRPGQSARLWRADVRGDWARVGAEAWVDPAETAISSLSVHAGQIYAGTTREGPGGQVWRSLDGQRWTKVVADGLGAPHLGAVRSLASFDGAVYAGTASTDEGRGAVIWRSTSGDPGAWAPASLEGLDGGGDNEAVETLAIHRGALFAGTRNAAQGGGVWRSGDGLTWRQVTTDGLGSAGNVAVSALAAFSDTLYAATTAVPGHRHGAEIWRCSACDGNDWERVVQTSEYEGGTFGPVSLEVFAESQEYAFLYAALGADGGLQVWRTRDGVDWEIRALDGLGDSDNAAVAGDGALVALDGRLYVGTMNEAHGAEVWSTAGTTSVEHVPTRDPNGPLPTPVPRITMPPPRAQIRYERVDQWPDTARLPPGTLDFVQAMDVTEEGRVFVLDRRSRVHSLNADGTWAQFPAANQPPIARIIQGWDIAVDGRFDRVYVSDRGSPHEPRIVVFDLAGRFLRTILDVEAAGMDVDTDGRLWVADRRTNGLRRFEPDGGEVVASGVPRGPFDKIYDVALLPGGGTVGVVDTRPAPGLRMIYVRLFARSGDEYMERRSVDLNYATEWAADGYKEYGASFFLTASQAFFYGQARYDGRVLGEMDLCRNRTGCLQAIAAPAAAGPYFGASARDKDTARPFVAAFPDAEFRVASAVWYGASALEAGQASMNGMPRRLSTIGDRGLALSTDRGFEQASFDGSARQSVALTFPPLDNDQVALRPDWTLPAADDGLWSMGWRTVGNGTNHQLAVLFGSHNGAWFRPMLRVVLGSIQGSLALSGTGGRRPPQNVVATTYEPTGKQFVAVRWRYPAPMSPRQVEPNLDDAEFLITVLPEAWAGRHVDWAVRAPGTVRWIDVDAARTGRVLVLDRYAAHVLVFLPNGEEIGSVPVPSDARRVAAGRNGEVYVLTDGGQVVRLASDGSPIARFDARAGPQFSPHGVLDLATDERDFVYVIDTQSGQVTVFAPTGRTTDVLFGRTCDVVGNKEAAPSDILLGDEVAISLRLHGTCGIASPPSDTVLALPIEGGGRAVGSSAYEAAHALLNNYDPELHRIAVVGYGATNRRVEPFTSDRHTAIQALEGLVIDKEDGGAPPQALLAMRAAAELFDPGSTRRRVLVLFTPAWSLTDEWAEVTLELARSLKEDEVRIFTVGPTGDAWRLSVDTLDVVLQQDEDPAWMMGAIVNSRIAEPAAPDFFVNTGTLVDRLPPNMDYVPSSAEPPAAWDAGRRQLSWDLFRLPSGSDAVFQFRVRPREGGEWPTNVEASADVLDGWSAVQKIAFRVPRIRVHIGEIVPSPTSSPTRLPTNTPMPTLEATPMPLAEPIFLPVSARQAVFGVEREARER